MFGTGKTDVGRVRANNEDTIFISNERVGVLQNFFVVADGMGGHIGGEVASENALRAALESIYSNNDWDTLDILVDGVKNANTVVFNMSKENAELSQMGTTFSAVSILDNKLYAAHVGDSRIYLISHGEIKQLTFDHTYVMEMIKAGQMTAEEARVSPQRNIITRAVGINDVIEIDGIICDVNSDDYILICSDGLSGMLNDMEILNIFNSYHISLESLVDDLIYNANIKGGNDNISVVVIKI